MIARLPAVLAALALLSSTTVTARAQSTTEATDPFLWLEQLEGPRVLTWVKAENAKTLAVLQKDPRFAGFYAEALKIGEAKDRIPFPRIINGRAYNFWQDQDHVRRYQLSPAPVTRRLLAS